MPRTRPTRGETGQRNDFRRCDCPMHTVDSRPYECPVCQGMVIPDEIDERILRAEARRGLANARASLPEIDNNSRRRSA